MKIINYVQNNFNLLLEYINDLISQIIELIYSNMDTKKETFKSYYSIQEHIIKWLKGEIMELHWYKDIPARETANMLDNLIKINEFGVLTFNSQPGRIYTYYEGCADNIIIQRGYISCLVQTDSYESFRKHLLDENLRFVSVKYSPSVFNYDYEIVDDEAKTITKNGEIAFTKIVNVKSNNIDYLTKYYVGDSNIYYFFNNEKIKDILHKTTYEVVIIDSEEGNKSKDRIDERVLNACVKMNDDYINSLL